MAQESPAPPPPPATMAELLGTLKADSERLEVDGTRQHHTGAVDLDFGNGVRFFADDVILDSDTGRLVATGNVVFANPEGRLSAEEVEYNLLDGKGTFKQAHGIMSLGAAADRTQFANQEPDVYFWGESIERVGAREYRITRGGFTTCVQPTPRWEVASDDVVMKINDYAIARNMVLRVKNVPVMYLPILYYPIQDDDRATGFLMPTYGTSTVRGQALSNAFFWAIGRSHDATLFHDWFTRAGQGAGAEYRYVTAPGSSGTFRLYQLRQKETEFRRDDSAQILPAETAYEVDISASHRLTTNLRAQATVGYFSSVQTNQLYHQTIEQATRRDRRIAAGLTGNFGPLATGAYYSRSEVFHTTTNSVVYGATPRLTTSVAPRQLFGTPVYASVDSTYAYLPYQIVTDGLVSSDLSLGRFEISPLLRAPLSRLTFLSVNTTASYRTTYYTRSLDAATGRLMPEPLTRNYLSLGSEIVGPVLAKVWDTPGSERTERMKHVIEPTFGFDYVTEINNQASVPRVADVSEFVVGGAMRVTYGVTNRMFYRSRAQEGVRGSTREFITIGLQQSYYTDPEASRYDSTYVTYAGRTEPVELSPIALTARVSPSSTVDANARLEYDVSGNGLQAVTVGSTIGGAATSATVNFNRTRYSPTQDAQTSLTGSTTLSLLQRRLTGSYALSWDLARGYIVSQNVTAAYMAQCCGIQLEFQKYNLPASFSFPSDVRFNFGFVLAGLGTFSNFFGAFGGQR